MMDAAVDAVAAAARATVAGVRVETEETSAAAARALRWAHARDVAAEAPCTIMEADEAPQSAERWRRAAAQAKAAQTAWGGLIPGDDRHQNPRKVALEWGQARRAARRAADACERNDHDHHKP